MNVIEVAIGTKNKSSILRCPFHDGECEFPNGEHFQSENFVGCKIVEYIGGHEVVHWVCHKFPTDMSITDVRDAFMRLHFKARSEASV